MMIPAMLAAAFTLQIAEVDKYWREITGAEMPRGTVEFAVDAKVSKSGKDAYTIKSSAQGVKITGSNERGTWYGLYDLLERRGGCRWFWDGDVVPKRAKIDLAGLDVYEEANFEYRGIRYFAHRGLTRFQAEHWGPAEWKREIDWMLKRRLNTFMLRIGQDDLFQRTFPDLCEYPDPSKPQVGRGTGLEDRSPFWSLQYRGQLRDRLQRYAFERGLMVPEDFGTMTHWYSVTPEDYLAKRKPEFLPDTQAKNRKQSWWVWDVRKDEWLDEYWKLTQTAVKTYGAGAPAPRLLHTIGLGERRCCENDAENFKVKMDCLDRFIARATRDYPDSKILLAGWDFYYRWRPEEVQKLVAKLDPKRIIIWDYEGDATRDYTPELKGVNNNFTKWNVVGKFPYTFSAFLAFENALDIRANYPVIEERQRIAQHDPACVGYVLWPESSHTDSLFLRYFTANAWSKDAVPSERVLDEFCSSRYGELAGTMKPLWEKVLPAARLRDWMGNYVSIFISKNAFTDRSWDNPVNAQKFAAWETATKDAGEIFAALAKVPWRDEFVKRDTIDLARTALDRIIAHRAHTYSRRVTKWCAGEADGVELKARIDNLAALTERMADVLELHTDYSLWESYERLDAVEKIKNPDFEKTLFDNATCGYCRSHQYELARHFCVPRVKAYAKVVAKAVEKGAKKRSAFDFPYGGRELNALKARSLKSLGPTMPRTEANFRKTMMDIASLLRDERAAPARKASVVAKARDFIDNEKQFHLGFLPTEQSNPITATLEEDFQRSTVAGVQCLQRGDRQIPITMRHVFAGEKFRALVDSMEQTLRAPKGRIIFSGCGATGRLSILLESMWRDFFHRRSAELTPAERALAERSASIMTGGDFALIKSVESFEDSALGGERQAAALQVGEGDTFVAITEGGETSSVLGTLRYAAAHGARCFLVFNNPADLLRSRLERCREAIDNPKVTVLDIYCGAMGLAGSTRMQATTSEQLLGSCALEAVLCRMLPRLAKETATDYTAAFERLLATLESPSVRASIAEAIEFEESLYRKHGRVTYFADDCMLDLFTDTTERSPTFMLPPFRPTDERHLAQSWAFVKNPLHDTSDCWQALFHRAPRCLEWQFADYAAPGMPPLKNGQLPKISHACFLKYPIGREPTAERWQGVPSAAVIVRAGKADPAFEAAARTQAKSFGETRLFAVCATEASPLEVWKHLAVKLTFNNLSTGTMVRMGRVAGNWMSWVSISNKKLIDRGIRLISELGHVDYEEAAQRLFEAEEWVNSQDWTGKEVPCAVQIALKNLGR